MGLHWTLAQCRLVAGLRTESLATLSRALKDPGLSACHRGRLLVLAARTHASRGEYEEAGRVVGTALAAAEQASDAWAMGWSLHTMAIVATTQGRVADGLPLYDRALEVTRGDPALTDLRLLLQINKVVALASLSRNEEALVVARRVRQSAKQAGATVRLAQARNVLGQLLFETGRWDDALAETAALSQLATGPEVVSALGFAALIGLHRGDAMAARGFMAAADPPAARIGRRRLVAYLVLAAALTTSWLEPASGAVHLTGWLDGSTEDNWRPRIFFRTPSG